MAALGARMQDALNDQVQRELYSGYLYLAMAAFCETQNLRGFSHWMRVQAREELGHAMKVYDHIQDRGGRPLLRAIQQPPEDFGTPLALFEQVLAHEQEVTRSIEELYALAAQQSDYASQALLQWFVTEQVEEERTAQQIVATLRMVGGKTEALLMLDRELGSRRADA